MEGKMEGKLVGTAEAAVLLGLSQYMLRKGVKEGRFPVVRTTAGGGQGKFLFDMRALERVIADEAMSNVQNIFVAGTLGGGVL